MQVSFVEVYCENAFDLLSGPVSASREASGACALRESADGRVYPDGAKDPGRFYELCSFEVYNWVILAHKIWAITDHDDK